MIPAAKGFCFPLFYFFFSAFFNFDPLRRYPKPLVGFHGFVAGLGVKDGPCSCSFRYESWAYFSHRLAKGKMMCPPRPPGPGLANGVPIAGPDCLTTNSILPLILMPPCWPVSLPASNTPGSTAQPGYRCSNNWCRLLPLCSSIFKDTLYWYTILFSLGSFSS